MKGINDAMRIHIQCEDKDGERGCFMVSNKTEKQFGDTYKSLSDLLVSNEAKFCRSHGIKLLYPGDTTV